MDSPKDLMREAWRSGSYASRITSIFGVVIPAYDPYNLMTTPPAAWTSLVTLRVSIKIIECSTSH